MCGPDNLPPSFIGTQCDPWDAHKNMALATLGAILPMLRTAALNLLRFQRDFAREWAERASGSKGNTRSVRRISAG